MKVQFISQDYTVGTPKWIYMVNNSMDDDTNEYYTGWTIFKDEGNF